ncbi:hypothetical protein BC832DRAFT_552541 [Gaertneriomyces semiglobifer]|nr:hypothetical protein BC832DRAFT_552541 [Gaertneriomyces semiglobifer]
MPRLSVLVACALFLAGPLAVHAQPEPACPPQSLFPVGTTDGSAIGITSECARECMRNANACVCGSQNPIADAACICQKEPYESDFVGCTSFAGCADTAAIALFQKYKADFCAGKVSAPVVSGTPTASAPSASSGLPTAIPTSVASNTTVSATPSASTIARTSTAARTTTNAAPSPSATGDSKGNGVTKVMAGSGAAAAAVFGMLVAAL